MNEDRLMNIWKSNDQKLDEVLSLNRIIVFELTKKKAIRGIVRMSWIKKTMFFLSIPYTLLLFALATVGYKAGAFFVTFGFGAISLIMTATTIGYVYHLYLIDSVNRSQDIVDVQKKIAALKLASFNGVRLAIVQIPFWSICWVSLDALEKSPFVYGGINLVVFLGLVCLSFWLYRSLSIQNANSKVGRFFLSGAEWEPIVRANELLEELEDLRK